MRPALESSMNLIPPPQLNTLLAQGAIWVAEPKRASFIQTALKTASGGSLYSVTPFNAEIDADLPDGGLRSGTVHEWFGSPLSLVTLLAGNAQRSSHAAAKLLLWIGRDVWPTPQLLRQTMWGMTISNNTKRRSIVDLSPYCIMINPKNEREKLWVIDQALRSPAVAAVICTMRRIPLVLGRKLSLAARQGGGYGFLLRPIEALPSALQGEPSSLTARWVVTPSPSPTPYPRFALELLSFKGSQPSRRGWIVELCERAHPYDADQQTLSLTLPAELVDQSCETKTDNTGAPFRSADHRHRLRERSELLSKRA